MTIRNRLTRLERYAPPAGEPLTIVIRREVIGTEPRPPGEPPIIHERRITIQPLAP